MKGMEHPAQLGRSLICSRRLIIWSTVMSSLELVRTANTQKVWLTSLGEELVVVEKRSPWVHVPG